MDDWALRASMKRGISAPLLEEAWDTFVADARQLVNTMCPQLGLTPFSMNILWYPKGHPGVGPHHDPSAYPAYYTTDNGKLQAASRNDRERKRKLTDVISLAQKQLAHHTQ